MLLTSVASSQCGGKGVLIRNRTGPQRRFCGAKRGESSHTTSKDGNGSRSRIEIGSLNLPRLRPSIKKLLGGRGVYKFGETMIQSAHCRRFVTRLEPQHLLTPVQMSRSLMSPSSMAIVYLPHISKPHLFRDTTRRWGPNY